MVKYTIMVKYLAQGHKWHDRDSNLHSTDEKHQSLIPVLLTAQQWHTFQKSCLKQKIQIYKNLDFF